MQAYQGIAYLCNMLRVAKGLSCIRVVGKRVEEYVPHRNARWAQHSERGEPVSDIEFLHQDLSVFGSAQDQP